MKDLFKRHEEFEAQRPQMRHSTMWYQERVGHEVDEWIVSDPEDQEHFLSEASDVFILWASALASQGISPEVVHQAILAKIALNEVRFPVELFDGTNGKTFDENYREAKRREGRPIQDTIDIYNPSISAVDHFDI